jgi:histone deacetylase 1/2
VGSFHYGTEHPMKPFRIKIAHQLIIAYELYRKMNVYVSIKIFRKNSIATKQSFRLADDPISL